MKLQSDTKRYAYNIFYKTREIYIALIYIQRYFIILEQKPQIWPIPPSYQKRAKHNFSYKSMKLEVQNYLFRIIIENDVIRWN